MVHSAGNAIDEFAEIGGDDESPLYLRVQDVLFHVYQLSSKQFAVAAEAIEFFNANELIGGPSALQADKSPASPPVGDLSRQFSGELFTEDGEVLICVSFRPDAKEPELLLCSFCELDEDASRQLQDLVELLDNDWMDSNSSENANQEASAAQQSIEPVVSLNPAKGTVLETADGRQIYPNEGSASDAQINRRISPRPRLRTRKWLLIGSACVIFMAGLVKFSQQTPNDNKNTLAAAPPIDTADLATTHLPALEQAFSPLNSMASTSTVGAVGQSDTPPPSREQTKPCYGKVTGLRRLVVADRSGYVEQISVSVGQVVSLGDVVAVLDSGQAIAEVRKLSSELKLASIEEETKQFLMESALRKISAATPRLKEDIASLAAELRASEDTKYLASIQWERIRPLAEKDNVGRKEVDQVRRSLQLANTRYMLLKNNLAAKQEILKSNERESALAIELNIPLENLKAELKLARSRVEYLREQIEIERRGAQLIDTKTDRSGKIIHIMVSAGDTLELGDPICEVQSDDNRAVVFKFPGDCRDRFDVGQSVPLRLLDSKVRVTGIVEGLSIDEAGQRDSEGGRSTLITVMLEGNDDQPRLPLGTMLELESLPKQ